MKRIFTAIWIAAAGIGTGCIHHKETVYRDVARTKVGRQRRSCRSSNNFAICLATRSHILGE